MNIGLLFETEDAMAPFVKATNALGNKAMGGRRVFLANYKGDVVCLMAGGLGRANAASATSQLIWMGCRLIVAVGSCTSTYGQSVTLTDVTGKSKDVQMSVGSVVFPTRYEDGDFDMTMMNPSVDTRDPSGVNGRVPDLQIVLETVGDYRRLWESEMRGQRLRDMMAYDSHAVCTTHGVLFQWLGVVRASMTDGVVYDPTDVKAVASQMEATAPRVLSMVDRVVSKVKTPVPAPTGPVAPKG